MTRRELRHALSLPVLVAALVCVVLSLPALAQAGQGQGRSQQDKSTHERSEKEKKGDADKKQRGNGKSRGEKRDRGRSDEHYQAPDDRYNSSNSSKARHSPSLSPQQAAQRARSQYGGQVLKVQPAGDGYQVRLLQEDGRVVTVPVGD